MLGDASRTENIQLTVTLDKTAYDRCKEDVNLLAGQTLRPADDDTVVVTFDIHIEYFGTFCRQLKTTLHQLQAVHRIVAAGGRLNSVDELRHGESLAQQVFATLNDIQQLGSPDKLLIQCLDVGLYRLTHSRTGIVVDTFNSRAVRKLFDYPLYPPHSTEVVLTEEVEGIWESLCTN